jgi:hypothetical protein
MLFLAHKVVQLLLQLRLLTSQCLLPFEYNITYRAALWDGHIDAIAFSSTAEVCVYNFLCMCVSDMF